MRPRAFVSPWRSLPRGVGLQVLEVGINDASTAQSECYVESHLNTLIFFFHCNSHRMKSPAFLLRVYYLCVNES